MKQGLLSIISQRNRGHKSSLLRHEHRSVLNGFFPFMYVQARSGELSSARASKRDMRVWVGDAKRKRRWTLGEAQHIAVYAFNNAELDGIVE
jgi:hypothetical protein